MSIRTIATASGMGGADCQGELSGYVLKEIYV